MAPFEAGPAARTNVMWPVPTLHSFFVLYSMASTQSRMDVDSVPGRPDDGALAGQADVWDAVWMPTNLNIDDHLLEEAVKVGGHRTKRETVNEALQEYVQRRRRLELIKYFGKVDFDPGWDHKKARRNR